MSVEPSFLQTNADWYDAAAYLAPFDKRTVKDINNWVKHETDGIVKDVVDELPANTVMALVNALAFEAEWLNTYKKEEVSDDVFTREDGTQQNVSMMFANENRFLQDENAVGFIKEYKYGKYAFAALLPQEGMTVGEYVATLTGEGLHTMLAQPYDVQVHSYLPKFEAKYSVDMSEVLAGMGMPQAFDVQTADFSALGYADEGNIYIDQVLHKTFISVAEKGTKAGAATTIIMGAGSAAPNPDEPQVVRLDRPFVYMIIDCEALVPLFIGMAMSIE